MYYYADCAPLREASFAIGNVSFLLSFSAAALTKHLFSNWPEHNAFQISPAFPRIS